jgi:hypothetical protein
MTSVPKKHMSDQTISMKIERIEEKRMQNRISHMTIESVRRKHISDKAQN